MLDQSLISAIIENYAHNGQIKQPFSQWDVLRELLTPEWVLKNSWLKNKKRWAKSAKFRERLLHNPYHYLTKSAKFVFLTIALKAATPYIDHNKILEKAFPIDSLPFKGPAYDRGGSF